jgi:hypothetical protein
MKTSIKIIDGKLGFGLRINGLYVNCVNSENTIKLIACNNVPCGMSEFVSISALRSFWAKYMPYLIALSNAPETMHYNSVWGSLVKITK